jgi:hypothetical protein
LRLFSTGFLQRNKEPRRKQRGILKTNLSDFTPQEAGNMTHRDSLSEIFKHRREPFGNEPDGSEMPRSEDFEEQSSGNHETETHTNSAKVGAYFQWVSS